MTSISKVLAPWTWSCCPSLTWTQLIRVWTAYGNLCLIFMVCTHVNKPKQVDRCNALLVRNKSGQGTHRDRRTKTHLPLPPACLEEKTTSTDMLPVGRLWNDQCPSSARSSSAIAIRREGSKVQDYIGMLTCPIPSCFFFQLDNSVYIFVLKCISYTVPVNICRYLVQLQKWEQVRKKKQDYTH